ncbi:MAG: TRAP transporter small permease subunit [Chloroflexota bacterium]|nr:TRAP transporter small permease subunit [Chloroflexota bacterium]
MKTVVKVIDSVSEYTGRGVLWLTVALVLVLFYETMARQLFTAPTQWAFETAEMIFCTIAVLGWAYVHRHHGHIRVDVFYARLSPRGKAVADVVCSFVFLVPFLVYLVPTSFSSMMLSWRINEKLIESTFMPPAAPIRTVIVVGVLLFTLQCVAQFIRDLYFLLRNKPYD